jgi:ribosome-associated protein
MNSDHDDSDAGERPSRSARKRTAESLQALGVRLIQIRDAELEALALPDELRDAVREARRMGNTPAQARQRQYIGRLMRQLDPAPIEQALALREFNPLHRAKMPR